MAMTTFELYFDIIHTAPTSALYSFRKGRVSKADITLLAGNIKHIELL